MIILDTDHLSELFRGTSPEARRINARIDGATDTVAMTIVSVEELMRGWLAIIHRQRDPHAQIQRYERLQRLLEWFSSWDVVGWDAAAADMYSSLRRQKNRVKTMDLKIACIALSRNAIVVTRNHRDFSAIPGLSIEDWMSGP